MNAHEYARQLLLGSFSAALAAADPLHIMPRHLPANLLPDSAERW